MKHFLKVLYAGFVNLYIVVTCVIGLFYAGIILFIKTYSAKGFAAIGMFLLGIVSILTSILFLYLIGLIFEYFMKNHGEKKEDDEENDKRRSDKHD